VCKSIFEGLKDEYLRIPQSSNEWQEIADAFYEKWNFPLCLGAIDGKHISIIKPPASGSEYFNYKKFCSIVLLAVVDADMKFIYVDVGSPGKCSDGGIWGDCSLNKKIQSNSLNLPEPKVTIGNNRIVNHVFVGDEAFPLNDRMMRPFSARELDERKRIYNYR
jgi:DDE superfamily endonuclease